MTTTLRRRFRVRVRRGVMRVRAGLSVLEIMVALTLFGTVTVSMAGLSLVVAKRAEANDVFTKRTAVLQQQMNWLQALPYDSLLNKAGTAVVTTGAFPHTRVITVTSEGNRKHVTVKITPTKSPTSAETITFDRAKPNESPLCKGC